MDNENMDNENIETTSTNYEDSVTSTDVLDTLAEIRSELEHPILTTTLSDYTVTEGLLLVLTLCVFTQWLVRILKRGFSWLLW